MRQHILLKTVLLDFRETQRLRMPIPAGPTPIMIRPEPGPRAAIVAVERECVAITAARGLVSLARNSCHGFITHRAELTARSTAEPPCPLPWLQASSEPARLR